MNVYRRPTRTVHTRAALADPDLSTRAGRLRFLIDFTEIESALADQCFPEEDGLSPETKRLRNIGRFAARLFLYGRDGDASKLRRALSTFEAGDEVEVSIPEGYAYYGLFPETYAAAAHEFFDRAHPTEVAVIGIRSIGASLGAVAGAALEERGCRVHSFTVRPHGHPFDRELRISSELERCWRALRNAHFAIVDEGPGLSGSSFASVAGELERLGIRDSQIVLFPSWNPDGSAFVSTRAREQWRRLNRYVAEFHPGPGFTDLSAGQWRELLFPGRAAWPETHPPHEARKYLRDGLLYKFAGLGRYGEGKLRRARRLAEAGFSPPVLGLENGFLIARFTPGQPLAGSHRTPRLLETMGRYLAFRRREFPALAGTLFGVAGETPVEVDGRMLPHEWIETAGGYLKTDAVDHCENHFHPGCTDIAWDLAGAIVEFELDSDAARCLMEAYSRASGDLAIGLRLPVYSRAYREFRRSYCEMFGLRQDLYGAGQKGEEYAA